MYYFLTLGSTIWSEDAKDTAIAQEKTDFLTFYGSCYSCCRFLGFCVCLMHQNFQNLWIWIGLAFSIAKYWIVSNNTWKQSRLNLVVPAKVSYAEFTKVAYVYHVRGLSAHQVAFEVFCRNPWICAFWLVQMFWIIILIGQQISPPEVVLCSHPSHRMCCSMSCFILPRDSTYCF